MKSLKVGPQEYLIRLDYGAELKTGIEYAAKSLGIKLAWVQCVGAVQRASLAFYDQERKTYLPPQEYHAPHEIVSCTGNVTSKEGKEFAHLHMVLSDIDGKARGGHVNSAEVFAVEIYLRALDGQVDREPDAVTGLALWSLPSS